MSDNMMINSKSDLEWSLTVEVNHLRHTLKEEREKYEAYVHNVSNIVDHLSEETKIEMIVKFGGSFFDKIRNPTDEMRNALKLYKL